MSVASAATGQVHEGREVIIVHFEVTILFYEWCSSRKDKSVSLIFFIPSFHSTLVWLSLANDIWNLNAVCRSMWRLGSRIKNYSLQATSHFSMLSSQFMQVLLTSFILVEQLEIKCLVSGEGARASCVWTQSCLYWALTDQAQIMGQPGYFSNKLTY